METMTINKKQYKLAFISGRVASISKRSETHVSGSGGGGRGHTIHGTGGSSTSPITISSTTTVHDDLFLIEKDGKEHSFHLRNFDLACMEGNTVTIAFAIMEDKDSSPPIAAYNNSTRRAFYNNRVINEMHTPHYMYGVLSFFVALSLSVVFLYTKHFILFLIGALSIIPAGVARKDIGRRRANKFKKSYEFEGFTNYLSSFPLIEG